MDLSNLVSSFKKDYSRLRTTVSLFLSEYRNELSEQKSNLNLQMAEAANLSRVTDLVATAVGNVVEEVTELNADETSFDLIDVPKIMVHSGSMTDDELQNRSINLYFKGFVNSVCTVAGSDRKIATHLIS